MVKGINKRIVEVNVTENEVFEKCPFCMAGI